MSLSPSDDSTDTTPPLGSLARSVMLRLPEELYEWLRTQAFIQRRSMNALGIEALLLLREKSDASGQKVLPEQREQPRTGSL